MPPTPRFKLILYTPPLALEPIKTALFATGAGTHNQYTQVCFTTPGVGQFKPSAEAKPAVGEAGGAVQEVGEVRLETTCLGEEGVRRAVEAVRG